MMTKTKANETQFRGQIALFPERHAHAYEARMHGEITRLSVFQYLTLFLVPSLTCRFCVSLSYDRSDNAVCDLNTLNATLKYQPTWLHQAYMYNDDDFNWNHGLSLGSTGNFKVTAGSIKIFQQTTAEVGIGSNENARTVPPGMLFDGSNNQQKTVRFSTNSLFTWLMLDIDYFFLLEFRFL